MNTNMNATIRRLTNAFIILFLLVSAVAAYVQISNHAFYNGPVLASGQYDLRKCPPYDQPLRGRIFDRNGNLIAQTVPDPNAPCGYRREYASWVADTGLAPLIGYYSYQYGAAGIEATYNDVLAGVQHGETSGDVVNKLLHKPRYGNDIYLTIDKNIQEEAAKNFNTPGVYLYGSPPCQVYGSHPPGSMIVENPNTGEILAMVSEPSYDPNRINDPAYWKQLNSDPSAPLLNHATQGLYDPGSTFKTVTLLAALDTGTYGLTSQFSFNDATSINVQGDRLRWDDYFNGTWNGVLSNNSFPLTLQQAYAYSDNVVFARAAVQIGADTWLSYVRKFGIATPGTDVAPVPFDAPYFQSRAYNAVTNGQPTTFSAPLLAESGFGQGQLFITPLTMAEITSTVAANGQLWVPHAVWKVVPHGTDPATVLPKQPELFTGAPIIRPETAQAARNAMWAVSSYGTAYFSTLNGQRLVDTGVHEGGKTGTGQLGSGNPQTWWISLAPDDQAPGSGPARAVITVMKEHSGEGACQVFVADNTYSYIFSHNLVPPAP
jgi:peptidoglycan glycosyltransferase